MQYDEVLQATLLLSCYFNKSEVKNIKPLTPSEYARFAAWLHKQSLTPANLLHDQQAVMRQWNDPKNKITSERIATLFSRGASMGFALEHWAKHGIWIVSRASKQYPRKIREIIGETRPPVLFGVGNQELLNKRGIGFVGSRSIGEEDKVFAISKAELAVSQGFSVVSGGAKGIDQTAMLAALDCGGESVGILADSLLKASASKMYREGLRSNRLALISPFYPESGFNTGNAMGRNKYIYAMSESVVVVKSDFDKGGTWSGAKENLKKQWVPLLVRSCEHKGNQELINLGGFEVDESFSDYSSLPTDQKTIASNESTGNKGETVILNAQDKVQEPDENTIGDLFAESMEETTELAKDIEHEANLKPPKIKQALTSQEAEPSLFSATDDTQKTIEETPKDNQSTDLFDDYGSIFQLFYNNVQEVCEREKTITPAQLHETYPELTEALIKKWLKQLEGEGYLAKKGRKLLYTLTEKSRA